METVSPIREIAEEVRRAGGGAALLCYQCGRCDAVCPWNRVRPFSIRRIVRQASLGIPEIEREEIWRCTTCGRCPTACPRGVDQVGVGTALRRIARGYGVFPESVEGVRAAAGSLAGSGNPLGGERGKRADWAEGLGVAPFEEGMDWLLFVGCYCAYDPRLRKVAVAIAGLLRSAGVSFGILGDREVCCGESIRKAGHEELFRSLARENIRTFIERGVRRIVVASPHCLHALQEDYAEFRVRFEVVHVTQLLAGLAASGRLAPRGEFRGRVAYHDPCYLGRHHGIYDAPRDLLRAVPGLELVELPEARGRSLCCGGGGGRIWAETPKEERFSDLRVAQAREAGAAVLATACPYCITNFEESRAALGEDGGLRVLDVAEILREAFDGAGGAP